MQSVNRGAMAVLLALATVGLHFTVGQFRTQRGTVGGHPSAAFLAVPPPGHHAAAGTAATTAEPLASALRRQEDGASFAPGASAGVAAVVAALAVGAMRAAAGRRRTARRATQGDFERDYPEMWAKKGTKIPYPSKRMWYPGEFGMTTMNGPSFKFEMPPPARQSLSTVTEAMKTFKPTEFYSAPAAKLEPGDVKTVGSCQVMKDGSVSVPAKVPTYVRPARMGIRLEQEKGQKRTPLETEAYEAYAGKMCHLTKSVQEASSASGFSMEKDFVCDQKALMLLLNYLDEKMTITLRKFGQAENPIDFVKISKSPTGKGLVLDCAFQWKNLWAEGRPYNGVWKRSERSERGNYGAAWERLASGDSNTKCYMVTGLRQIAGTRAGETPDAYQFVEYELGGFSFLTRSKTHLTSDGKNVELKHKNWYHMSQIKAVEVYYQLLLGGTDIQSTAFHRSGKIIKVFEATKEGIAEKSPDVVEAASKRIGRLVSLLSQVKTAIEKSSASGPWVLQWQDGELVLGEYKKVEDEVEEKQEEIVLEAA